MKIIFLIALSYFTFIGNWIGCLVVVAGITLYFFRIPMFKLKFKYWLWGAVAIVFLLIYNVVVDAYVVYSQKVDADSRGEIPTQQAQNLVTLGWKHMHASQPAYQLAMDNNQAGYKLNHPEAAANIGMLYEYGWGVEKDEATAADWYQKAVAMGPFRSAQADYQLAGLYEKGQGVERNLKKAIAHFAEAQRIATKTIFYEYRDEKVAKLSGDALDRLNGNAVASAK